MAFYVTRSVHMKNSNQHFQRKLKNLTFIIKKRKEKKRMSVLPMKKGQRAVLEGDGVYLASQAAELTSHVNFLMMSCSFLFVFGP
jgi:hypothetical protein